MCWAITSRTSGESSAISMGGATKSGALPSGGEGIWRCLALEKLSGVELLDGLWQTTPHARQHCVEHIEVDAEDYPGDDPQYGQ